MTKSLVEKSIKGQGDFFNQRVVEFNRTVLSVMNKIKNLKIGLRHESTKKKRDKKRNTSESFPIELQFKILNYRLLDCPVLKLRTVRVVSR